MSSLVTDVLGVWLLLTAASSLLLVLVVGVQGAVARTRRRRSVGR